MQLQLKVSSGRIEDWEKMKRCGVSRDDGGKKRSDGKGWIMAENGSV